MKTFSNETLRFSSESSVCPTFWILPKLCEFFESCRSFTRNFVIKELWALENHVLVNILLCSSHFTEGHLVYIRTQLKTFSLPFSCPSYLDALLRCHL